MATHWFNEGKRAVLAGEIEFATDDIRCALCMTNTNVDTDLDFDLLSQLTLDECDSGGTYSRKTMANKAVTVDDTNDLAKFDADDVTWTGLAACTRAIQGVLIYLHVGADSANIPLFWLEFASNKVPDGSDFTVRWSVSGLSTLS